ncbi:MAG: hypothetical protein V3V11_03430, partial [Vicinamibacteria bacterium]
PLLRGPEECVGYRFGTALEDDGSVLAVEPPLHASGEFDDRHRIGGSLVLYELVIQLSEELDVFV